MSGRVWVLNFDADLEFEQGENYVPDPRVTARFKELALRCGDLVPAGDKLLEEVESAAGLTGHCFSPSPRALAALKHKSAEVPRSPAFEILRRANSRKLCFNIGPHLPGAAWITSEQELDTALAGLEPNPPCRLRSLWGFAGRGTLAVRAPNIDGAQRRWTKRTLGRDGALELVPWVDRTADFGLHGFISATGEVTFGAPTVQQCSPQGAWQSTRLAAQDDLSSEEFTLMTDAAKRGANTLLAIGYFGPFGIDAFRWQNRNGAHFHPLCDLNARYSMGWAVGMREQRVDLTP